MGHKSKILFVICIFVLISTSIYCFLNNKTEKYSGLIDIKTVKNDPELYNKLGVIDETEGEIDMKHVNTLKLTQLQRKIRAMNPGLHYLKQNRPSCYATLERLALHSSK